MAGVPSFPAAIPGGGLIPHMSAKRRTQLIDALFEDIGGFERAKAWVEKNDDNFREFFLQWMKGAAKASSVEVNAGDDIADLIKKLDEEERFETARVIDGAITDAVEK